MLEINEWLTICSWICWQCESMATVERKLKEMKIDYAKSRVEESGINVDQLFFHDPDGSMIEICNCDVLPVVPLAGDAVMIRSCASSSVNCNFHKQQIQQETQINQQPRLSDSVHMKEDFLHCASWWLYKNVLVQVQWLKLDQFFISVCQVIEEMYVYSDYF